jgi:hypothetical protein
MSDYTAPLELPGQPSPRPPHSLWVARSAIESALHNGEDGVTTLPYAYAQRQAETDIELVFRPAAEPSEPRTQPRGTPEIEALWQRLRDAVAKLRRTPMPIADLVPLLQAADALEAQRPAPAERWTLPPHAEREWPDAGGPL